MKKTLKYFEVIAVSLSILLFVCNIALARTAEDESKDYKRKVEKFITFVKKNPNYSGNLKKTIVSDWNKIKKEKRDPNNDFIIASLIKLEPKFREGMKLFYQEYYKKAIELFKKLSKNSKNKYLVANSHYVMSRALLKKDEYENACNLLRKLHVKYDKYFASNGEATFLLGLCYSYLLHRELATAMFKEFLKKYPNAPERYRMLADRLIKEMKLRSENELLDLSDRMKIVKRLLHKERTGKPTQRKEDEIIKRLNELIKKAEEKEKKGKG